ncbi:uncharacterized protein LOC117175536 [Belonocnema kinseyi]|uniref:uncharacterized protein LOC117175536 n=1 Tax=Belonocnema kinseyi TaxID=2817044 RepID=UPI00143DB0C2|nr:uncharacterized protein LOC117175536 [Belonocnema kinseyi]
MSDTFTKYTKLYPIRKATSEVAIQKLDEFAKEIGAQQKVLSDQGTQFTSYKWRQALEQRKMKMILTSIKHPQANIVERVNRELARLFRTLIPPDQYSGWYRQLENIETVIDESHHDTTEITPYEAMWGRKPRRW